MTASSSYSGTVDNLWSRADIRVHTSGGTPKAVEALLGDLFKGKPTRTAGAKRQGAEAARQPVSAGVAAGTGAAPHPGDGAVNGRPAGSVRVAWFGDPRGILRTGLGRGGVPRVGRIRV